MTDGVERDWDEHGGDGGTVQQHVDDLGHKNMFHTNDELIVEENLPQIDPCNDS